MIKYYTTPKYMFPVYQMGIDWQCIIPFRISEYDGLWSFCCISKGRYTPKGKMWYF